MAKEIERKWLVSDLARAVAHSTGTVYIAQAYLSGATECFVRVLDVEKAVINILWCDGKWWSVEIPTKDAEEILLHDNDTLTYRIRRYGENEAFITVKGKSSDDGLTRDEWEYPISVRLYNELVTPLALPEITKYRHYFDLGDLTIEIDEFRGDNTGLVVAEIEFPVGYDMSKLKLPTFWIGEEVTGDVRYYNSMLLKAPYSTWPKE